MKIKSNFLVVSNHNNDISWIKEYTDNYIIYDRSDTDEWTKPFDPSKIIKVPNIGWDIYDKFTYIIDNYDNLPETIILAKGNTFKYITREEFDAVCNNTSFTSLLTKNHRTYLPVSFYKDGIYNELNNSWYLRVFPTKHFKTYNDFAWRYMKKLPRYVQFAPGSNYLVTKNDILRYSKSFYEQLRSYLDYTTLPGEAQIMERALFYLWNGTLSVNIPFWYKVKNYIIKSMSNILFDLRKVFSAIKKKLALKRAPTMYNGPVISIAAHKKTEKIYDIFTYNGEADVLEIRLNILNDVVDQFIIVEAPTTFSGKPKPLYFECHKERFSAFAEKIKYFVIDDYPNDTALLKLADESPNVPKSGPEHWRREFYQKESIKKALTHLSDEDICFIGDVDEVWNPTVALPKDIQVHKLQQLVYTYYLNNRSSESWAGTLVARYKTIKESCLNHLRTEKKWNVLKHGGWHFTSMGGLDEVRRKLNDSYTEESYNTKDIQQKLEGRFGKKDCIGRSGFKFWIDETDLPNYILENKNKYQKLFKTNE